jgi:benzoate-CoA ligase family protein
MRDHTVQVDASKTPAEIRFPPVFNAVDAFIHRHPREGRAEKTAIRTTAKEEVSYAQLAENVNRCGNRLAALGARPGERVLMVVKDAPEFFYLFWGAIAIGAIPVPLNTLLRSQDYRFALEDSRCMGLVYSPEFTGEVEPALVASGHRPDFVVPTEGAEDSIESGLDDASPELAVAPAKADDDCFWLYSSGSTGPPKAAVHCHRDLVVSCQRYAVGVLGMGENDVCFSAAKLFFAYGLGNAMTFPLWVGGTAVLSDDRPTAETTFAAIEEYRTTIYFAVPTLYAAQLRHLDSNTPDLSSLRLCVSAGEALPASILRRWRERTGLMIFDGIGSTETLHIFISNRMGAVKPGTSGRLVPGYRARIVDDSGAEVAPGETGRLWIQGDSTASRYWNNPERTAATMVEGWLDTGDTYIRDEEGYFHYRGRSDDMLKVGGIWCSPFEIEARLIEHPEVLEAAVVGRTDENGLVKPEAFVVPQHPESATEALAAELLEHCKKGLARYKYPRWFRFVPELPRTATEKIQRFRLRSGSFR